MLTATQHERIDRYLAELTGALGDRPEAERDDVVAGVREHIQAALADRPAVTDDAVDDVLRALGDPLAIGAEASGPAEAGTAGTGLGSEQVPLLQRGWIPLAVVAPLTLGIFALLFFVSFGGILLLPFLIVGSWIMLWLSPLWVPWEKVIGTVLLPAPGLAAVLGISGASSQTCVGESSVAGEETLPETCSEVTSDPVLALPVTVVLVVAGILAAVVLYRNGRRRAAAAAQSFSTGA